MSRTQLAFLIGGGLNTALSYGVYLLLVRFVDYQAAYLIAYIAGIFSSYWINSVFVFRTPMTLSGLLKFPLVYLFQYVASALLTVKFVTPALHQQVVTLAGVTVEQVGSFLDAALEGRTGG